MVGSGAAPCRLPHAAPQGVGRAFGPRVRRHARLFRHVVAQHRGHPRRARPAGSRRAPVVDDAGVVGVPSQEWGEAIAAVVVPKPGASIDVGELQAWVRVRLRSAKVPEIVRVVGALPYRETGKLLRRVIREQLAHPDR